MRLHHLTAGMLALALSSAPVAAQAAAAPVRSSAPVAEANEMGGDSSLLYILGAIALGVLIFLVVDGGDDDPDSP